MFRAIEVKDMGGYRNVFRADAVIRLVHSPKSGMSPECTIVHLNDGSTVATREPLDALLTKIEYAENPR